jgi:Kef-type K+ transport system membrane component KefB
VNEVERYVEANPKKPYKTYAAMVSAFLSSLLVSGIEMPPIVKALVAGVVAALAVYLVKNPIRERRIKKAATPIQGDRFLPGN